MFYYLNMKMKFFEEIKRCSDYARNEESILSVYKGNIKKNRRNINRNNPWFLKELGKYNFTKAL